MQLEWKLKSFEELTSVEVFDLLAERIRVFVVEQDCPYQEADELDKISTHLYAVDENGRIAAYIRILAPGNPYEEAAIGRVLVAQEFRGGQLGRQIMERGMKVVAENWPNSPIRIGAQVYLNKFYASLGFVNEGEEYLEDGIPHIEMLYTKS